MSSLKQCYQLRTKHSNTWAYRRTLSNNQSHCEGKKMWIAWKKPWWIFPDNCTKRSISYCSLIVWEMWMVGGHIADVTQLSSPLITMIPRRVLICVNHFIWIQNRINTECLTAMGLESWDSHFFLWFLTVPSCQKFLWKIIVVIEKYTTHNTHTQCGRGR